MGDQETVPAIAGNYIYRHHEPRDNLFVPYEGSFPTPLEYIDVVRRTNTTLDVLLDSHLNDDWNVDGGRELSGPLTGFTQFSMLDEELPVVTCGLSRAKKRSKRRHKKRKGQFILPRSWTCATSRTRSWSRSSKKYKGRVVLRGDVVKCDSGSYAVFAEHGSSVTNDGSESSGRDRQTTWKRTQATQYPPTPSQNGGRSQIAKKLPQSECPDIWIRLTHDMWPKAWHNIEERVVSLERNLHGRPLAGVLGERQFERSSSGTWIGECTNLRMPVCSWKKARSGIYVGKIDETR